MHDWVNLLKDRDLFKEKCFIGGEWVDAVDGETIDVRSPTLMSRDPCCQHQLMIVHACSCARHCSFNSD